MDPETFALRKNFLEEFLKERVKLFYANITINLNEYVEGCSFKTCVKFAAFRYLNINTKEVYKLIKQLIYYLYSITYKTKILREKLLLFTEGIVINYKFNANHNITTVNTDIHTNNYSDSLEDSSFLKFYNEKELSESHTINIANNLYLFYLEISLDTFYVFDSYEDYVLSIEELEENGEVFVNTQTRKSEEKINSSQTFKTDECVICLNNPPHVLFCNCGHLCICKECDKIKTLSFCPVCKTENTILRLIE